MTLEQILNLIMGIVGLTLIYGTLWIGFTNF